MTRFASANLPYSLEILAGWRSEGGSPGMERLTSPTSRWSLVLVDLPVPNPGGGQPSLDAAQQAFIAALNDPSVTVGAQQERRGGAVAARWLELTMGGSNRQALVWLMPRALGQASPAPRRSSRIRSAG